MESYLSVSGENVTEKVIEKSRFITSVRHVESEEEAKAFVAEISKNFADATHNCYAYICDEKGNFMRFSDDGEPQGTAGMPMLEVLKNKKLVQVAAVVTRYFGGIKLGAGGLVRAYSGCVAENLLSAQTVKYELCSESVYGFNYAETDAANRFFANNECSVLGCEYGGEVAFRVAVKAACEGEFNRSLNDFVNGRVKIKKEKEYFYPFKV